LTGGLGGAIFTWFATHPGPTTLTYNAATSSSGANAEAKSVVPNLRLQIGTEAIDSLYTHTISFSAKSGPRVASVTLGITFLTPLRLYGWRAQAPSGLHYISCTTMPDGLKCTLGPLSTQSPNKYAVVIATNQPSIERIFTTDDHVILSSIDVFSLGLAQRVADLRTVGMLSLAAAVLSLITILYAIRRTTIPRRRPPSNA
jgi:hypothetical protein